MKIKKFILSSACLTITALSATTILSSCFGVSKEIRDNLTDRGDGLMLSNNISLEDTIKNALSDESGANAYLDNFANVLIAQWFQDKKDTYDDIKDFLDDTEKDLKDEYDKEIKNSKEQHKGDWKYHFQNDVLNPVGGTKEAWFNSKRYEKYRTKFSEYAFKNSALGIPLNLADDGSSVLQKGVKNGSYSDLTNSDNWEKINFFANVFNPNFKPGETSKTPVVSRDLADQFSLIQKMTYELLLNDKHPISVAMSLWKYSEPTDGLDTIYAKPNQTEESNDNDDNNNNDNNVQLVKDDGNDDSDNSGDDDNKTFVTKASYEYPYFKKSDNPLKISSQKRYANLLEALRTNTGNDWNSIITSKDGLFNLRYDESGGSDVNFTEDSSTLMGVNLSTQFDELDNYFAGTVAQAVNELINGTTGANSPFSFLANGFKTNAVLNKVDIMENFMYRSGDANVINGTIKNYIDLNELFGTETSFTNQSDFHSPVFNTESDYYKSSNNLGGVRYVINTVRTDQTVGATTIPIYLVRDTFGVHFIAIDGYNYIKKQVDAAGSNVLGKQKAFLNASANVIKYRTIAAGNSWYVDTDANGGSSGVGSTFSNDSLKSYFDSNFSKIVLAIWNQGKVQGSEYQSVFKDFKYQWDGQDGDVNNDTSYQMSMSVMNLVDTQQKISTYESVNKKLFDISKKYTPNAFLSNINANNPTKIVDSYEIDELYQNGLASPLEYTILSNSPSQYLSYDIASTVIFGNSQLFSTTGLKTVPFSTIIESLMQSVQTDVATWYNENAINIKPSFSGEYNKWSETIFTTHIGVNLALNSYGSSGNKLSNPEKVATYSVYIHDLESNTIFNGILDFNSGNFWTSQDVEPKAARSAFISTYILPSIISSNTPICSYIKQPLQGADASTVNANFERLVLDTWKQNNFKFVNGLIDYSDEYVSFLSTISTILWFSVDNDTVKSKTDLQGNQNDGRLIDQLAVTVENNKAAYICWLAQSNLSFDSTFANPTSSFDSFDMSKNSNPNGVFNNLYQKTSNNFIKATSFGDNSNWWNYASTNVNNANMPLNGYLGLQTTSSSSLPAKVNNALFNDFGKFVDPTNKGLLFKYGSLENLKQTIDDLGSVTDLDSLAEDLAKSSTDFAKSNEYFYIKNRLYVDGNGNIKTGGLVELSNVLIQYVDTNFNNPVLYERVTMNDQTSGAILTDYTNSNRTYLTEIGSDDYEYSYRTFFIPVRFNDFDVTAVNNYNPQNLGLAYQQVKTNLFNIFGQNVYYSIFVQTAMTTSNSDRALAEIIKWVNGDDKITEHDKRIYDQLGKEWMSKWRTN